MRGSGVDGKVGGASSGRRCRKRGGGGCRRAGRTATPGFRLTSGSVLGLIAFLAEGDADRDPMEVGRSGVPPDAAALVSAGSGDMAVVAWPVAGSFAAVVVGVHRLSASVSRARRGLGVGGLGSLASAGYLFALQFDLADGVRDKQVCIVGMLLDVDPSSECF